jgi:molybdate-binding protein/DNA-binding XRE family transcriptional regulator
MGAAELARLVGVSRQTIYAIEAGDYVPNTAVALQLARVLEAGVEELFRLEDDAPPPSKPAAVEILGEPAHPGQPVQLCRVGKQTVGVSAAPPAWGLTMADGVVSGLAEPLSRKAAVQVFQERAADEKRLLVAGCDPAISLLAQYLLRADGVEMILAPCSSRQALEWLKEGKAHMAGSHWKDDRSGEYNLPLVKRLFPQGGVQVITFAIWEEGLVVARGNPKAIRGVEDLARKDVSIMNREEGAGSRQLLDKRLAAAGISGEQVHGYNRTANGHLPAALAVSSGYADCCIATRAASRAFGLDFLPLAVERYDLVVPRRFAELAAAQAALDALNRSAMRRKLETLAGYDTSHTGERISG